MKFVLLQQFLINCRCEEVHSCYYFNSIALLWMRI